MSLAQHTKSASLIETVYNVYEAKRASEVAPGVGKLTDMALIRENKIKFFGPEMMTALETAHKEKPGLSEEELQKLKQALNECSK